MVIATRTPGIDGLSGDDRIPGPEEFRRVHLVDLANRLRDALR